MSDTPRTDAEEQWAEWNGNEFQCVHSSFARELELALRDAQQFVTGEMRLQCLPSESDRECLDRVKAGLTQRIDRVLKGET